MTEQDFEELLARVRDMRNAMLFEAVPSIRGGGTSWLIELAEVVQSGTSRKPPELDDGSARRLTTRKT